MCNAPCSGYPILFIRGRGADGGIYVPMHYACGDGDGLMPPFDGWFVPLGHSSSGRVLGYTQVTPVEWQPLEVGPLRLAAE